MIQHAVPLPIGDAKMTIEKLVEMVNLLQGVSDQNQRAVRVFEFEQRLAAVEARLKAAGF